MDAKDDGIYLSPLNFDFSTDLYNWEPGFSDYPDRPDDSVFYELKFAYAEAPSHLNIGKAIMLSGNNHSDDLFMFIRKKITGLKPDAFYTLTFNVEMASNAATGSVGAGGSPGESVFLKAGAASIKPESVVQNGNHVMNIDKGNQGQAGRDMIILGNIATQAGTTDYALINRTNSVYNMPFEVKSNGAGELWLIIGTDSGFEGVTSVYYTKINVVMSFRE